MLQTLRNLDYSKEQIGLLLNSKPGTLGANLFGPIVFFLIYVMVIPFWYIFIWLSLQLIVFFIRVQVRQKGLKAIEQLNQEGTRRYFIYYLGTIFCNALLWGGVSILVLQYTEQTYFYFYIIVLFGLGAAGSSSIGVVFHAMVIFLSNTLMVALIVSLYYNTTSITYLLCFLMLVYFFFMLKISFGNHSFIATNIEQKEQITKSHNLIKESIEYAALIQKAMLPKEKILESYFKEYFIYFKQRDVVGGDFYSVIPLGKDELLVMVFDGVGHGVSGAFMTMLIKATEHQIITEIHHHMLEPNPALVLSRFNVLIKTMTEDQCDKKVMIGFDGGVLYFNKKASIVRYAGAKMALYTIENSTLQCYKGDRKGIGFTRTPIEQGFTEHEIPLSSRTKFYLATDGIFDQESEDGRSFGQERFEAFLLEHYDKPLMKQYETLQDEIEIFSGTTVQLDDSTVLGFSLKSSE